MTNIEKALEIIGTNVGHTSESVANQAHMAWATAKTIISELCTQGKVHRAKLGHKVVWYFTDPVKAQDFVAAKKAAPDYRAPVVAVTTRTKFDSRAQIIVPQGVTVQECPPFRGLGFSETQPKERAFSSLGVGRYLPDEDAMLRRVARKGA